MEVFADSELFLFSNKIKLRIDNDFMLKFHTLTARLCIWQ